MRQCSLVPRLPVFFIIITNKLYYSVTYGGNKEKLDVYNLRKLYWEPGLQSRVTDVTSRRVVEGGKCISWTLDWTGLMDWTDGLKFGLRIRPKNQPLGSN